MSNNNMSRQEFMESMVMFARDDLRHTNDAEKVIASLTEYGLDIRVAEMMVHKLQLEKAENEIQAGRDNVTRGTMAAVIMIGGSMLLTMITGGIGIFLLIPSVFLAPLWVAFGFFQQWSGRGALKILRENPPDKSSHKPADNK